MDGRGRKDGPGFSITIYPGKRLKVYYYYYYYYGIDISEGRRKGYNQGTWP